MRKIQNILTDKIKKTLDYNQNHWYISYVYELSAYQLFYLEKFLH